MSFNDMLATFKDVLNRDDCTDAKATTFLQQGMSRVQRECRLPSMERAVLITPTDVPMLYFPVPKDLIQPIDLLVPNCSTEEQALQKLSFRELVRHSGTIMPRYYARSQGVMHIRGALPVGEQLQFIYYGNFSDFASGDDENELSATMPDLGVYAALRYAADSFQHPSVDRWEATYQEIKSEAEMMAIDLDGEGGPAAVQPIYHWRD